MRSTAEIEAIKLLGTEPMRGGTRVIFVAGGRVRSRLAAHEARNARPALAPRTPGRRIVSCSRGTARAQRAPARNSMHAAEEELADRPWRRAGRPVRRPVVGVTSTGATAGFLQQRRPRLHCGRAGQDGVPDRRRRRESGLLRRSPGRPAPPTCSARAARSRDSRRPRRRHGPHLPGQGRLARPPGGDAARHRPARRADEARRPTSDTLRSLRRVCPLRTADSDGAAERARLQSSWEPESGLPLPSVHRLRPAPRHAPRR